MTPAFRIEEHHEAFLVWHYAIRQTMIPGCGNILLHVDEHSDWATPRLRHSLEDLGTELTEIAEFTYTQLDIGNFIWPAVYTGILEEVCWMRHRHTVDFPRRRLFIRPLNEERTEFITGLDSGADARVVTHSLVTTDAVFEARSNVILDIDLDYFSSNLFPDHTGHRVEITEASFKEFANNRYHFLRLAPGSRISAAEEDGRHFLYFNRFEAKPRYGLSGDEKCEILSRLDRFVSFLDRNSVVPRIIVTCRSRHSGYTPRDHCEFIEENLWNRLNAKYDCVACSIDDILTNTAEAVLAHAAS